MFTPRSEKTRQLIIEETASVFNKKGYAGTSMADLTAATGLTKGSIYGNFKNKEEVALAVFDHNLAMLQNTIKVNVDKASSGKGKLLAYVRSYQQLGDKLLKHGGCPLLNTGTEADDTHEPLRKRVHKALKNWKKQLIEIIEAGIKNKEFKSVDAEKRAIAIIALIQGGMYLTKAMNDSYHLDTALGAVVKIIKQMQK